MIVWQCVAGWSFTMCLQDPCVVRWTRLGTTGAIVCARLATELDYDQHQGTERVEAVVLGRGEVGARASERIVRI